MSISRNFFNEIRPFFRLFDDVAHTHHGYPMISDINRGPFGRQFEPFLQLRSPSVDLSEQGNEYIVEAEVPGVKKEDLNVQVGDGGRSITVEGQLYSRSPSEFESAEVETIRSNGANESGAQGETKVAKSSGTPTKLSVEREFVGSTHFNRTIWLPRPVNGSKVVGKLSNGILTIRVPKAEEKDAVKVEIQ